MGEVVAGTDCGFALPAQAARERLMIRTGNQAIVPLLTRMFILQEIAAPTK
jgi:hypothetical protein